MTRHFKEAFKKFDWKQMVESAKEKLKKYSDSESFYEGDIIEHQKYGLGYVHTSFSNKIEVFFEDKARILVHKVMF